MKLNHTDNGNGQMAIVDENLRCVAFIPKSHPESEKYIKLFENAPLMLEMLIKFSYDFQDDDLEDLIKKATEI